MIIKELEGTDLFSYEQFHLPLEDLGLVFVDGVNLDDGGSNGAGKTTLFKALTWTLFNDALCGQRGDDVIRQSLPSHEPLVGKTCGAVHLEVDGEQIEVRRHRQHEKYRNKLLVFVDGKEKTFSTDRHSQSWLCGRLLLDSMSFKNTVMFPQNADGFASGTDAEQKAVLDRVLNFGRFAAAREGVTKQVKTETAKLASMQVRIAGVKGTHAAALMNAAIAEDLAECEEEGILSCLLEAMQAAKDLGPCPEFADPAAVKLKELTEQLDALLSSQAVSNEVHERRTSMKQGRDDWIKERTEQQTLMLSIVEASRSEEKTEFPATHYVEIYNGLLADESRYLSEIDRASVNLDREQEALQKLQESTCYTCGQTWPEGRQAEQIAAHEKDIASLQQHIKQMQQSLEQAKKVQETTKALIGQAEKHDNWVRYHEAMKRRDKADETLHTIDEELAKIEKQLSSVADSMLTIQQLSTQRNAVAAVLAEQTDAQVAWRLQHRVLQDNIAGRALQEVSHWEHYTAHVNDAKEQEAILRKLQKQYDDFQEQVRYLELWQEGFGNRGVKSLILDTITPFLNQRSNEYLRVLTGGNATVEFTTQTELASGEKRDKFAVNVSYKHGFNDYNGISGGEAHRVDVAAMFALGDLSSSRARAAVRLRLLDEPFDNLDSIGKERVFELMRDVLAPKVGTLLVMSHDDSLTSRFENRMTVIKEGGISRIET